MWVLKANRGENRHAGRADPDADRAASRPAAGNGLDLSVEHLAGRAGLRRGRHRERLSGRLPVSLTAGHLLGVHSDETVCVGRGLRPTRQLLAGVPVQLRPDLVRRPDVAPRWFEEPAVWLVAVVPGSCPGSGAVERVECGVVGVGQGVEVFLGGAQAAVAEAFFDGLDVGAAGE